jgi:ketosteroid isomerase-like protein
MHIREYVVALLFMATCRAPVSVTAQSSAPALKEEIESLHQAMVAAFKQDPPSVARFYTDDASILGGGQRAVGREQVKAYWSNLPKGAEWTLEVLEVGGDSRSPWVRGRSTLGSQSGRRFVTEYIGILKRGSDGQLRFYVDMYVMAGGGR